MPRTPGAKNRSPRELRAEAKRLNQIANYKETIKKLREVVKQLKKKKK